MHWWSWYKAARDKTAGSCISLYEVPWKLEVKCKAGVYLLFNFGYFHPTWYCQLITGVGRGDT